MVIKCKMCGGDIEFNPGDTYGQCVYCGSSSALPKANDEQKLNRHNRANHFRRQCEFDKAIGMALNAVLNLNKNKNFIFTDQDDLKKRFSDLAFTDGTLPNLDTERSVIGKTSEPNNYLRLFYRIRDAFAHGKYCLVFHPVTNEKMVVMEDNSPYNFTARLVL